MESPPAAAPTPTPEEAADRLADARFVRVIAAPTGAALATSGVVARALRECGVPFQVRVRRDFDYAVTDDALTLRVGTRGPADLTFGDPQTAPARAFEVARELGTDADPRLALAGVAASEADAAASTLADAAGLERAPGVGVPVADLADGLGHTTLLHAPFSRGADAAGAALAELGLPADLDEPARRRVASLAALETATASDATPRAAEAVGRALNPLHLGTDDEGRPGAPFATVEGYADVLCAVVHEEPGTGVALALGHDARTPAIEAWRTHARRSHATLRGAETARHAGLFVVRAPLPTDRETREGDDDIGRRSRGDDADGDANADADVNADADADADVDRRRAAGRLRTVARLARDFRSPEPTVLVVSGGLAAAATHDDATDVAAALVRAVEATVGETADPDPAACVDGAAREADARFEVGAEAFETAAREAFS